MRRVFVDTSCFLAAVLVLGLVLADECGDSSQPGDLEGSLRGAAPGLDARAGMPRPRAASVAVTGTVYVVDALGGELIQQSTLQVTSKDGIRLNVDRQADGVWQLTGPNKTCVQLLAQKEGYPDVSINWMLVDRGELRIPMQVREPVRIIVRAPSGAPVGGARCLMSLPMGGRGTAGWTDDSGLATLNRGVPSVRWHLVVKHPDYLRHEADIAPEVEGPIVVTLDEGAELVVIGVEEHGLPREVPVQITAAQGGVSHLMHASVDSVVVEEGVAVGRIPYGRVAISVTLAGSKIYEDDHLVDRPEYVLNLASTLRGFKKLSLLVVDELGVPIGDARCRALHGSDTVALSQAKYDDRIVLLLPAAAPASLLVEAPSFVSRVVTVEQRSGFGELRVTLDRLRPAMLVVGGAGGEASSYKLDLRPLGRCGRVYSLQGIMDNTEHSIIPGAYRFRLARAGARDISSDFHVEPGQRFVLRPSAFDAGFYCRIIADGGHFPIRGVVGSPFDPASPTFLLTKKERASTIRMSGGRHPVHVVSASGLRRVGQVDRENPMVQLTGPPPSRGSAVLVIQADRQGSDGVIEHGAPRQVRSRVRLTEQGTATIRLHVARPRKWIVASKGVEIEVGVVPGVRKSVSLDFDRGGTLDLPASSVIAFYRRSRTEVVRATLERESSGLWRLPCSSSEILIIAFDREANRRIAGRLADSSPVSVRDLLPIDTKRLVSSTGLPLTGRALVFVLGEEGSGQWEEQVLAASGFVKAGKFMGDLRVFGSARFRMTCQTDQALHGFVGSLSGSWQVSGILRFELVTHAR